MQRVVSAELARDAAKQKEFLQIPSVCARELLRLPSSSVKRDWVFTPLSLFSLSVNSASDARWWLVARWGDGGHVITLPQVEGCSMAWRTLVVVVISWQGSA